MGRERLPGSASTLVSPRVGRPFRRCHLLEGCPSPPRARRHLRPRHNPSGTAGGLHWGHHHRGGLSVARRGTAPGQCSRASRPIRAGDRRVDHVLPDAALFAGGGGRGRDSSLRSRGPSPCPCVPVLSGLTRQPVRLLPSDPRPAAESGRPGTTGKRPQGACSRDHVAGRPYPDPCQQPDGGAQPPADPAYRYELPPAGT